MPTFIAYVPNFNSDNVSVVNLATNSVITTIALPAGSNPYGSVVNNFLVATKAYITNSGNNTVSVIDTFTNTVIATIPVGNNPRPIAINNAGTFLYVGNFDDNTISVIDTATNTVVTTIINVSTPSGLILNANDSVLYVTNFANNTVTALNLLFSPPPATIIPVGINPIGIDIDLPFKPAPVFIYVANNGSNSVSVIDTATNTVFTTILTDFNQPFGVALQASFAAPLGENVLVTNQGSNSLTFIEPQIGNTFTTFVIPTSASQSGIAYNPNSPINPYALTPTDNIGIYSGGVESATVGVGDNPISLGHFAGIVPEFCPVITLSPTTLSDGRRARFYAQTIVASGGTAPYAYFVSSGTLPTGVTLNTATGEISGTPTVTGAFTFTIGATDVNGCPATPQQYTVTIANGVSRGGGAVGGAGISPADIQCVNPADYTTRPDTITVGQKNYRYYYTNERGWWCYIDNTKYVLR